MKTRNFLLFFCIFFITPSYAKAVTIEDITVIAVQECLKKYPHFNPLHASQEEQEKFYICRDYTTGNLVWVIGSENIGSSSPPVSLTDCKSSFDGDEIKTDCFHY